ncbi:hypothetical protein DCAR_0310221 [Daucus carota subsp. sativus]|uniref:Tetratricopeptide repeat protein 27 homolog n=1 Tax=Daucus carota subsp. sativus TaxID=79200 RepID=A0AAF1APR4_DAUCS|nr:PREDICTED: tetratricopeptide repeat protein 27 homolog [Daucus carota subsp. sativus]WOG90974.1 hypothetical protein DCAR_0310221 [Daucus carota subsp. sativus]
MAIHKSSPPSHLLRAFELRLLRCSFSPSDLPSIQSPPSISSPPPPPIQTLADELLQFIESGDYAKALASPAARQIFDFDESSKACLENSKESAKRFYSETVRERVEVFLRGDDEERLLRGFVVMAVGVAAFLAFTQCNFTGPLERFPLVPLLTMNLKEADDGDWLEWEIWARNELMITGSELQGKFSNLQYIVFAKILLMRIKDWLLDESLAPPYGLQSISWWLVRLLLIQQKVLDELSSYMFDLLQVFMRESSNHFGTMEKVVSYWGANFPEEEAQTIVAMLYLEMGIVEHIYGRVDSSSLHFKSAEVASGLHLSVSGALGFRTVHQVEPKAQLVLSVGGDKVENNMSERHNVTCENSDILLTPRLVDVNHESCNGTRTIPNSGVAILKAVQQAVILAQCLSIEKSSRHNEMQRWEMAPYIEAIDSQQSSDFIVRCFCDILRVRWESSRSHTKERALLMMDKLVQGVRDTSLGVAERIYCCFGVHMPSIPKLRKEYGDLLVRCGLIGEAVKVYEDLELWDTVIYCYCLLEKKASAVELIKKRLAERPSDPRLWCSLGDVTNDDACYEKALEVSENRSARAKRSLARSAYNRNDYELAKILWESAMAMNSLFPDGWFALGAAALKARDVEKAMAGFTRSVQLDPDNGEAWNNIACLHMIKKQSKESFIAFKEALKFKRNSWELWDNFSHVAADIGNYSQALEAVGKILELTNNRKFNVGLLENIFLEIEQRSTSSQSQSSKGNNEYTCNQGDSNVNSVADNSSSENDMAKTRETNYLIEVLGKLLKQIVCNGGGPEAWGLFARWHKLKGDLTMCSEALLKQVRALQGSDLWNDGDRFKKFAHASLELSRVYVELSSLNNSRRELFAAEMHLKNTIKLATIFSEYEEFRDLQACLAIVQIKLRDSLTPVV